MQPLHNNHDRPVLLIVETRAERARQHLPSFVERTFRTLEPGKAYHHNWHIDHICWRLSQVAAGKNRRLIINVPPRSMKSITVSVAFTAWTLGRDPTKRIIAVSYADELAKKLAIDTRNVMESDWYRALFPALQPRSSVQPRHEYVTSAKGFRFASGIGGAILGRGGDLIVIDDPIKALDALSEAERRRVWDFYIGSVIFALTISAELRAFICDGGGLSSSLAGRFWLPIGEDALKDRKILLARLLFRIIRGRDQQGAAIEYRRDRTHFAFQPALDETHDNCVDCLNFALFSVNRDDDRPLEC
ncbi:hypothetical protein IYY11_06585 [Methylocystis sp. H62]|nr:hypothetical protein [Methylocystis sp. H62]MBG0793056.1 hypothetical protein [Methylocystis sp. H62]